MFRAVVKALGVYQLVLCLADLLYVMISRADFRLGGPATREWHYLAWAVFHFCMAAILIFGTGVICRIAVPPPAPPEGGPGGA